MDVKGDESRMTTRLPGLDHMASRTGVSLVTMSNHAYSMTDPRIPAPFNTKLGRGHRQVHLKAEWLCSTILAAAINDPKNAFWQVPACGLLLGSSARIVQEYSQELSDVGEDPANPQIPTQKTTWELSVEHKDRRTGYTLFHVIVDLATVLATEWEGVRH